MSRIILVIGIIFTIISAIISYYVINNNQVKMDLIRNEVSQSEDRINQLWKIQQELEQRHTTSIMLYALVSSRADDDPAKLAADNYVKRTMQYHDIKFADGKYENIKLLPEKLNEVQTKTVNDINDLYANKLSLEAQIIDMNRSSEIYKMVGLFLQLLGLILVLYFKP